jgi:hypothetical protein
MVDNGNNDKRKTKATKPKARDFFSAAYSSNARVGAGIDLVNENKLLAPGQSHFLQNYWEPGLYFSSYSQNVRQN